MHPISPTPSRPEAVDVAIVGGGLAGLTAALHLARCGRSVTVIERAAQPGGRAASDRGDGLHLDRGPRALYLGGPAEHHLRRLGVTLDGARPPLDGEMLLDHGSVPLPSTAWRMLTSPLSGRARWQLVRALMSLPGLADRWRGRPFGEYLASLDPSAAAVIAMYARTATYCFPVDELDAGRALDQLAAVARGVLYVHRGWQSLVDDLTAQVDAAGVNRMTARALRWADGRLALDDGRTVTARAPLVAASPKAAAAIYDLPALAADRVPVRAACLTLALDADVGPRFALGRTSPLFYVVASRTAELAPDGIAVVHAMRYLAPGERGAPHRATLEELLDRMAPGWRDAVRTTRWMPEMTVAHDRPTVTAQRTGVEPRPGCFVAGDWVGCDGWLADAAIASAVAAAEVIDARLAASMAA